LDLSSDQLTAHGLTLEGALRSTLGKTTGKYYWEISVNLSAGDPGVGVVDATTNLVRSGSTARSAIAYYADGHVLSRSQILVSCPYGPGDVIGVALDAEQSLIWFSRNGAWQAGDPAAGTAGEPTGISGALYPAISVWKGDEVRANFGQTKFAFRPPSGFGPLFE
jgi:hypothetical protein